MGVTGLWKLIEASGKPVPLETLENKILAIDISIWLHQVIKGFQDSKGGTLPNAHLLGLFHRLCKLLFYRIRPIFVFDGGVPALKRQTMAKRAQSKNKLLNEADRLQSLLLSTLAKEKVVQQALGGTAIDILSKSPAKGLKTGKHEPDDMFKLPPLTEDELMAGPSSAAMPTDDDTNDRKTATQLTLHSIDVDSSNFKTLPADVRHEILTDIKETRKQNSWGRLHELPVQADNFSSFQMQRLLKRRRVQVCLESAEKEMGGKSLSVRDLETLLTEEGVVAAEMNAKRINSDDRTRFLMVSSIKEAMQNALQATGENKRVAELGPEFDEDLKRAVQMSLNAGQDPAEAEGEIYMSQKQKSNLTEAAKEMARAYMMEYAGMSKEDVQAILEGEEGDEQSATDVNETLMDLIEKNELKAALEESLRDTVRGEEENVIEASKEDNDRSPAEKALEIIIDTIPIAPQEDDLFADVFGNVNNHDRSDEDVVTVVEEIEDSSEEEQEEETESLNVDGECDPRPNESVISVDSESDNESGKEQEESSASSADSSNTTPDKPVHLTTPLTPSNAEDILKSLEKQKKEILGLTLDDLEVNNSESIIEIPDSPEGSDSTTPSKKRDLTDYFQTTPRKTPQPTPEKETGEAEVVPYVKKPFFVKKTPRKSSEKKQVASPSPKKNAENKATKVLEFGGRAVPVPPSFIIPPTNEELIKEASDMLRSQKTSTELEDMAGELRRKNADLEQERNKQSRFGLSVTERMSRECQDMLQLFGIPYIVAPMEAEAQCAFLNEVEITHGTITDDSDVWLFGGATVYKNFFDQKKHVMEFKMATIEQLFHVDRQKLIQLAMLVGSDYTAGITGIGAVTGMEILAQFPGAAAKGLGGAAESGVTEYQAILSGLRRFKEWWAYSKTTAGAATGQAKGVLRNKLKNISIGEGFPSQAVMEAYLHPIVDNSRAAFSWGSPDVETIREFAKKNFGWTRSKTDELLLPVVKKLEERTVQRSIKNYFNTTSPGSKLGDKEGGGGLKISKRVQRAVRKLDPMSNGREEDEGVEVKKKKVRNIKATAVEEVDSDCQVVTGEAKEPKTAKVTRKRKAVVSAAAATLLDQPSTSKRSAREPRIPETIHRIPQRDRTKQLEEARKKKAAEIFKGKIE